MADEQHLSIYLRSEINEVGLHFMPGPVIEARQDSDRTLRVVLRDLANDKKPFNLESLGVFEINFIVRTHKYPESEEDIVIKLPQSQILWHQSGYVDFTFTAEDLQLPVTDYWYDIVIEKVDNLFQAAVSDSIRPPLGVFKVVK